MKATSPVPRVGPPSLLVVAVGLLLMFLAGGLLAPEEPIVDWIPGLTLAAALVACLNLLGPQSSRKPGDERLYRTIARPPWVVLALTAFLAGYTLLEETLFPWRTLVVLGAVFTPLFMLAIAPRVRAQFSSNRVATKQSAMRSHRQDQTDGVSSTYGNPEG